MIQFWLTVIGVFLVALPFIALAAWGMSKLLVKEPPRGWWNDHCCKALERERKERDEIYRSELGRAGTEVAKAKIETELLRQEIERLKAENAATIRALKDKP